MVDIAVEHGLQVTLAEDEQAVCTFGAYGADESFGDGVHTGCLRSGEQHVDADRAKNGVEGGGELSLPVPDQALKPVFLQVRGEVPG
jgi:hypothetical protein